MRSIFGMIVEAAVLDIMASRQMGKSYKEGCDGAQCLMQTRGGLKLDTAAPVLHAETWCSKYFLYHSTDPVEVDSS
jgi:hypothetical protein